MEIKLKRSLMFLGVILSLSLGTSGSTKIEWDELPNLPPAPGKSNQPGLAGAFIGVDNGALIVAGGANFPDGPPWIKRPDGSTPQKIYQREIYLLLRRESGYEWKISEIQLPVGYSYGVSIPTEHGLLCIGGEWQEYSGGESQTLRSNRVFLIRHHGEGQIEIEWRKFPPLPAALSSMAGAKIKDHIYIAGGHDGERETKHFWSLDISKIDHPGEFHWEKHPPWPGPPRSHPVATSQSNGRSECFYLYSGRFRDSEGGWRFLTDAYEYEPSSGSWSQLPEVAGIENKPVCVMAATAVPLGVNHIAIFGGDPGDIFRQVQETIPKQITLLKEAGNTKGADRLEEKRWELYNQHPGFSRSVLAYHTITKTWTILGRVPETKTAGLSTGLPVTTKAVEWEEEIVIPSGEVRPGVRSTRIWRIQLEAKSGFASINYIILAVYLAALVGMGIYFSRRERSTDDFFKAGGRIPWWAAGLSIFGTQLSAITFMAIPAMSYHTDWTWLILNLTIFASAPVIVLFFLPFYRRLNVTTAYEYIEKRFNVTVRLAASFMFILFQFARIGIVLYLPSIALSVVTGIEVTVCIALMALLSITYTVLGGIEAVIWTDVIQVFVLLGGSILVLFLIPFQLDGGIQELFHVAADADKFRILNLNLSLQSPTLWVLLVGGFGANLISYGSDQSVIQRYLTTRNEKEAASGIWTNAVLTIPSSLIFFGIGTALYTYFRAHPQELSPMMDQADAIFPWFIATQLPTGLGGLLIAGMFAAAMSSLDSSMNSVSAAFTTDFYRRFRPFDPEPRYLFTARVVTVVIGLCGMMFALAMATWDIRSLWEEFSRFIGLLGGGLGGLFVLAIFTRRANGPGAFVGLIGSAIVQVNLQINEAVHGVLLAATGILSCIVIGYAASLLMNQNQKKLDGLTLYTLRKVRKN